MTDSLVQLTTTPLAPQMRDVRIRVRDFGSGPPLVLLHGGWGYAIYPFDRQIDALRTDFRIVIPDRTGYGASGTLAVQLADFHRRAAGETFAVLDALDIDRAAVWGHSDGAVIALHMALLSPDRVSAVVAEAAHFYRDKPRSRGFFESMRDAPDDLGPRVGATLEREHGSRWRDLIRINGEAWLAIAAGARGGAADLYDGRLAELAAPTLFVHGARDPRTEPDEFDAMVAAARRGAMVETVLLADGGHSPHSERATADAVTAAAAAFLARAARPHAARGAG